MHLIGLGHLVEGILMYINYSSRLLHALLYAELLDAYIDLVGKIGIWISVVENQRGSILNCDSGDMSI